MPAPLSLVPGAARKAPRGKWNRSRVGWVTITIVWGSLVVASSVQCWVFLLLIIFLVVLTLTKIQEAVLSFLYPAKAALLLDATV